MVLQEDGDPVHLFLILGDTYVGKTCFLTMFKKGEVLREYVPTMTVDLFTKILDIDDETVKIQIWDCSGQEQHLKLISSFWSGAQGVMVMFDITDQNSFVNVQIWLGRIRTYCKQGVSVLLVGNKSDLGVNRDIEARAAEELADREGLCYKEMSARNLESVNDVVTTLTKMVKEQNRDFLQMAATKNFPVPAKEKDQCCSLS